MLWVGAGEGRDPLEALAATLERALRSRGFGRADRPFKAHLTIGRPRVPGSDWAGALVAMDAREIARFRVAQLVLVKSQLSPKGSIYTVRVEAPLEGLAPR